MRTDLERIILGTLLVSGEGIEDVDLQPDDFSSKNRPVFRTIQELFEEGKPYDMVSVLERLEQKSKLKAVGGRRYITELTSYANIPSLLPHYADMLRQRSRRERLVLLGQYLTEQGSDPHVPIEDLVAELDQTLTSLEKSQRDDVLHISQVEESWAKRLNAPGKFVFPWPGLRQLVPELLPGDLVLVAGRPSSGKSSLLLSLGRLWASQGRHVLYISMEMTKEQIYERLLSAWCGISMRRLREPSRLVKAEIERLDQAKDILSRSNFYVLDEADITPYKLRATLRKHKDVELIMIDYIQLMRSGRSHGKRYEEVSYISRALKVMSMDHQVVTFAAAQLNRDPDKRGEDQPPQLSDLRDSSALESDADVVLLLWRKNPDDPSDIALRVGKNRNGPVGYLDLEFHPDLACFAGTSPAYIDRNKTPLVEDEVPF